jgi:hypothetical protein
MKINLIKLTIVLLSVIAAVISCDTENSISPPDVNYFVKYYGGDGYQYGVDFIANADGTLMLLGNSEAELGQNNQPYLVKVDSEGKILWEKVVGEVGDKAKDIERTNDGNFVILCDFQKSSNNTDIKLLIVSAGGSEIRNVEYGSPANDDAKSVTLLADGGFIITGATRYTGELLNPSNPEDFFDIFHYRCSSNLDFFGEDNWRNEYGQGTIDKATNVFQQSENLYYVFAYSNYVQDNIDESDNFNSKFLYYSLTNTGANPNLKYVFDLNSNLEVSHVMRVPPILGEGFLIVGKETSSDGTVSLYASKLRSPLSFNLPNDIQFSKRIPIENRNLNAISAAPSIFGSQGYLILANEKKDVVGGDIWLTKIGLNGNEVWSRTFGSEEHADSGAAVLELENGKILLLGTMELDNNQTKMVLMKLNSNGQLTD